MKKAIYYDANGAIKQVSEGPDFVVFGPIEGLTCLEVDPDTNTAGKHVENGLLVDGVIDTRTPADKLRELQVAARAHLAGSDWIVARAYERQEPVPEQWATYREALRVIIRMTEYQDVPLPTPPA